MRVLTIRLVECAVSPRHRSPPHRERLCARRSVGPNWTVGELRARPVEAITAWKCKSHGVLSPSWFCSAWTNGGSVGGRRTSGGRLADAKALIRGDRARGALRARAGQV